MDDRNIILTFDLKCNSLTDIIEYNQCNVRFWPKSKGEKCNLPFKVFNGGMLATCEEAKCELVIDDHRNDPTAAR